MLYNPSQSYRNTSSAKTTECGNIWTLDLFPKATTPAAPSQISSHHSSDSFMLPKCYRVFSACSSIFNCPL